MRDGVIAWYDGLSEGLTQATIVMTFSRVAVLTGGAALLAAWMSSAASTVPSAPVNESPTGVGLAPAQSVTPTPALTDFDREVTRLSARIEQAPRPLYPGRNPFALSPRTRVTSRRPLTAVTTPAPVPVVVDTAATAPVASVVSLAGIGTERMSYGRRRTAILSADGRAFLVRVGDEVMGRFQVRAVTDDSVELLDLRDGTPLHLTLP